LAEIMCVCGRENGSSLPQFRGIDKENPL
jgi:hypothetical protein